MTELRDARLKRALQSAPDESTGPSEATRRSIREAARRAVAKPAAMPWWRRWWGEPQTRMPWNAACATVLLAVLVGAPWHGQEVPDATSERAEPVPAAPPPAASSPAPAAVETAPPPAPATKPSKPAVHVSKPMQSKAAPPQPQPTQPPPASPSAELAKQAAPDLQRSSVEQRSLAASATGASRAAAAKMEARVATAPAPAPTLPSAPVAAPAPPAAPAAAVAQGTRGTFQALPAWTDLRIVAGARTVVVPRAQAPELAAAIQRMLASAESAGPIASLPDLRIELLRDGQEVTVIELTLEQVRVTDPQAPWMSRVGRTDVQAQQQLRDAVEKLLPR